jgi:hypothetical protein
MAQCRCGRSLPPRTRSPGRPRILCDTCRRRKATPARPVWNGPILASLDREYSDADSDNPVALAIARNLAARLDGCSDPGGFLILSRSLERIMVHVEQHRTGPIGPDPLDELALWRQLRE